MQKKNIIIAIVAFLLLATLTALIVYLVYVFKKNPSTAPSLKSTASSVGGTSSAPNSSPSSQKIPDGNFKGAEKFVGEPRIDEDADNSLEKLKAELPQLTESQLLDFSSAAKEKSLEACHSRKDEELCVFSVAFISRIYNFCGDLSSSHGNSETNKNDKEGVGVLKCYDKILDKKADVEVYNCYNKKVKNEYEIVNCLTSVFPSAYKKPEDCQGMSQDGVRSVCEGVVRFNNALMAGDASLCQGIKEEFLREYCLKNI